MDITEEKKSSEGADNKTSDLSKLFQKYKIEYFFWRSYKDKKRFYSFISIIVTLVLVITFTVLFWMILCP